MAAGQKTIRVLTVGDHALLRKGIRALIDAEADMQVVAEASNGREAGEDELSEREIEVLRLIAAGNANKELAAQLGLAEDTVKRHVTCGDDRAETRDYRTVLTRKWECLVPRFGSSCPVPSFLSLKRVQFWSGYFDLR